MKKKITKTTPKLLCVNRTLIEDTQLSALAKMLYITLLSKEESYEESELLSALGIDELRLKEFYSELIQAQWISQVSLSEYTLHNDKTVNETQAEVVTLSAPVVKKPTPKPPSKNMKEVMDGDRVISYLLRKRREIQPDYARNANIAMWQYEMRVDLLNSHRSAAQYIKCIDYLYSGSKEAQFWRDTVKDAQSLIKHYDSIELKFMGDKKVAANASGTKAYVNVLRRQGLNDEQIQAQLAKEGLI